MERGRHCEPEIAPIWGKGLGSIGSGGFRVFLLVKGLGALWTSTLHSDEEGAIATPYSPELN